MNFLITFFVTLSYFVGAKAIVTNRYRPSIYSRAIWLLLALNSFASVLALKTAFPTILLAGLVLLGSLVIFLLSIKKSKKEFGQAEFISSILLILSLAIWIFTQLPLLNLTISLLAHFIGGIPTYKKVLKNPKDEDIPFWLFFFIGSLLTLLSTDTMIFSNYLYPLYFVLFDGGMVFLCMRRYVKLK